jgi:hypothetical protein
LKLTLIVDFTLIVIRNGHKTGIAQLESTAV